MLCASAKGLCHGDALDREYLREFAGQPRQPHRPLRLPAHQCQARERYQHPLHLPQSVQTPQPVGLQQSLLRPVELPPFHPQQAQIHRQSSAHVGIALSVGRVHAALRRAHQPVVVAHPQRQLRLAGIIVGPVPGVGRQMALRLLQFLRCRIHVAQQGIQRCQVQAHYGFAFGVAALAGQDARLFVHVQRSSVLM